MSENLRVFIVDDSTVFRSQIRAALEGEDGIEVVGFATDGKMACEALKHKKVDVVTLDMEMPVMNGLETLKELRRHEEMPRVLVFSSHTKSGAEATLSALQLGASDFLLKPTLDGTTGARPADVIRNLLIPKINQFRKTVPSKVTVLPQNLVRTYPAFNARTFNPEAVVIASSTGGPSALERLFSKLRPPLQVPIFIVQHMPPIFTQTLAERLGRVSGLSVAEARNGDVVKKGHVYIAPGDFHMRLESDGKRTIVTLDQAPQRCSVRPCADFLFESAAAIYKNAVLGVVLTGMGADGTDGSIAIKSQGGAVLIQDKESCVVFGMPGSVHEKKAFDLMANTEEIAMQIIKFSICQGELEGAAK